MKKLISYVLAVAIATDGLQIMPTEQTDKTEITEVVETQPIAPLTTEYLTEEDFEDLYSYHDEEINDSCLELSQEDAWMLMKLGCAEGGADDALAQAYIMKVVLNRLADDRFPNTIKEIIYQDSQFSVITDGRYEKTEPNVQSHLALVMIETNEVKTDALYFEASWLKDSWQFHNREFAFEYCGTRFYK
jgi:N-acetylmuramoyl-L-alanine amidase